MEQKQLNKMTKGNEMRDYNYKEKWHKLLTPEIVISHFISFCHFV